MDISDVSKASLLYYYDKKTLIVIIIRCSRHIENRSLVIITLVQLFKVGYKVQYVKYSMEDLPVERFHNSMKCSEHKLIQINSF